MNIKVAITADSTCDLSKEIIRARNIELIPLGINLGDKSYLDGVDVMPSNIYEFVRQTGELPKTSAVTPLRYSEVFQKLVENGKDVVHINLSSAISSTHQNAVLAASEFENVFVADSRNLCTGLGLLVLKACDYRDMGMSASEITTRLEFLRGKVRSTFVVDTLEYLYKGGRCSSVARMGANLLSLKPSIAVNSNDGTMAVSKKYRGKLSAVCKQFSEDVMSNYDKMDKTRIIISHSGISMDQLEIVKKVVEKSGRFDEMFVTTAGCTISSHCGPNTLGIMYMEKYE